MVNGIRTSEPHRGLNKGRGLKCRVGLRVRQETSEEGCSEYNNENNCSKTLNDKNDKTSSQKFRQLIKE